MIDGAGANEYVEQLADSLRDFMGDRVLSHGDMLELLARIAKEDQSDEIGSTKKDYEKAERILREAKAQLRALRTYDV